MTKLYVAAVAAMVLYACSPKMGGQTAQTISDANGNKMLLGQGSKKDLQQAPFGDWFNKNETDYTVDKATADALRPQLGDKRFSIFMGTWCGDSKREVPRMYKVLEAAGVNPKQIMLVMVNNSDSAYKQSPGHEERGLHIHRVPTLIVWQGKTELGRVVETPVTSLEKDLMAICSGQHYTPKYAAAEYLEKELDQWGASGVMRDSVRIVDQLRQLMKHENELNAYAKILLTSGQMDKALSVTQLIAICFATKADAWYMAGAYQQMVGNKGMAQTFYTKALDLQPGHENATKQLAELKQ